MLKRLLCCGTLQGSADQAGSVGGSSLSTNGTGVQSELVNRVQLRYQCKVRTGMCNDVVFGTKLKSYGPRPEPVQAYMHHDLYTSLTHNLQVGLTPVKVGVRSGTTSVKSLKTIQTSELASVLM